MQNLLTQIKPSCFEDLIAVLALFRPGPLDSGMVDTYIKRRDGKEPVRYPDDKLREILSETYGVIVYQEQVMQIAQVYAGYNLGQADLLRRAMGKKKAAAMAVERDGFLEGAVAKGHRREQAEQIFQQMETFAAYGFNKSHSAAYALVTYQTAYLKAHHPKEFFAALLSMEMDDTDKVYKNLADCRHHGIRVLPPDVNESSADFTVCDEGIRFGLDAVKGVGTKAIELITEARKAGPFRSLGDFCARTQAAQVNRRILEGLIRAGAFDGIEPSRARLLAGLEAALAWAARVSSDRDVGQMGLFGQAAGASEQEPALPEEPEWDDAARLAAEHEVVGLYISGHPLDRYADDLAFLKAIGISDLDGRRDEERLSVAGVTNTVRRKNSRKGDRYATFNLEDREGVIEVIAWPDVYRTCEAAIIGRDPVLVTGRMDRGERNARADAADDEEGGASFAMKPQIIAEEILPLSDARRKRAKAIDMRIRADAIDRDRIVALRDALKRFPGPCRSTIRLLRPGACEATIELPADLSVDPSDGFRKAVEAVLGPGSMNVR
jgi:DNA polymerase-3 subunit alpha